MKTKTPQSLKTGGTSGSEASAQPKPSLGMIDPALLLAQEYMTAWPDVQAKMKEDQLLSVFNQHVTPPVSVPTPTKPAQPAASSIGFADPGLLAAQNKQKELGRMMVDPALNQLELQNRGADNQARKTTSSFFTDNVKLAEENRKQSTPMPVIAIPPLGTFGPSNLNVESNPGGFVMTPKMRDLAAASNRNTSLPPELNEINGSWKSLLEYSNPDKFLNNGLAYGAPDIANNKSAVYNGNSDKLSTEFPQVTGGSAQGAKIMDGLQLALDVAGLVPGFGEVADGLNALISLVRGNYLDAALSAAAMIPFAGWGATAGKGVKYALKAADAAETAAKHADDVVEAGEALIKNTNVFDDIVKGAEDTSYLKPLDELDHAKSIPNSLADDEAAFLGKKNVNMSTEGAGNVFKSTPELENHIQHIDTSIPRNRGIGGAHNSKEFFKNDVKIVKAVPSEDIPGVTYYQYNIPKLGKDGWPVGEYGTKIFEKTVYDPSVISDSEYTQRGLEAASNSYKTNGRLGSVWEGYDSQGVKWIGYGKNGKPTSFFPDVPKP